MVGILGVVWLLFFLLRKDLRDQQLFVSVFTAPLGPVTQIIWFYKDYWRPEYVWTFAISGVPIGVEEILFAFFIGGIGSVLYEVIFRKQHRHGRYRFKQTALVLISAGVIIDIVNAAHVNTVWASSIALVLASLIMIAIDKDLRKDWVMSSILMFVFVTVLYLAWLALYPALVSKFWLPSGLSGVNLFGVPIEELSWFVSWAMFSGVAYEFMVNAGPYSSFSNTRMKKTHAKI